MNGERPVNLSDEEKAFDPFENEPDRKGSKLSGGTAIAWLALLVALLAAADSGYRWWQAWQAGSEQSEQAARVASLQASQADMQGLLLGLESRLAQVEQGDAGAAVVAVEQTVAGLEQTVAGLDRDFADNLNRQQSMAAALFEMEQAIAGVETTLAAVTARGDSPAQRIDMYEVESLLRLASERLQLFAQVEAADEALALADERMAAMADPVYLAVRQRIARSRQMLAELELPDPVLIEGRIAALQAQIPRLPFPGEQPPPEPEADAAPPEGLWQRFKHTLSGLVTVRRKTADDDALLTIGDKDYLRQGLWLQLETARLSMMRRDSGAYRASLARAADTLGRYFDTATPTVKTATQELAALGEISLEAELPDISAPWSQLRLLRQAARPTLGAAPAVTVPTAPAAESAPDEANEPAADEVEADDGR